LYFERDQSAIVRAKIIVILRGMNLPTELYSAQAGRWPARGRCILAHFDSASIVVYQAYRRSIGEFAIRHGHLGGPDFNISRMSWIKPNFLWMMYRSGWGVKEKQEVTLGLRSSLTFFDSLLEQATPSAFDPDLFENHSSWQTAMKESDVRLHWDPDHSPTGALLPRRAIQLGLRGSVLKAFARREVLEVIDLTCFVESQRMFSTSENIEKLRTPVEHVYVPQGAAARRILGPGRIPIEFDRNAP
jgi:hypothetical protein